MLHVRRRVGGLRRRLFTALVIVLAGTGPSLRAQEPPAAADSPPAEEPPPASLEEPPAAATSTPPPAAPRTSVQIVAPLDGATFKERAVTVRARISGARMTRLRFLVNGQAPRSVGRVQEARDEDGDQRWEQVVELPPRDCVLTLIAESDQGAGAPQRLSLRWAGGQPAAQAQKPRLYLLSVGVSEYRRPELRLSYPAKDARDLALALTEQAGRLYRSVHARVLADEDATRENVLDGLKWLAAHSSNRDVAVIFLAGHGINDPTTGEFRYLPHDADPGEPLLSMIDAGAVVDAVRKTSGKVLVFLDACHAGTLSQGWKVRGLPDQARFIAELSSAEPGVVIFASSTSGQVSAESPSWGNGAFTKALVEGLRGQADGRRTGRVTVSMLDLYVSERVKELTGGRQTPTTARPPGRADFPLAIALGEGLDRQAAVAVRRAQEDIAGPVNRRWHLLGLGASVEAPLVPDGFSAVQVWPHLGLSFELRRFGEHALHLRTALGPLLSAYQRGYYAPGSSANDAELLEQTSQFLGGAQAELGLELRLRRRQALRPSFGLGARLGGIGNAGGGAFLYGFPLRARLSLPAGPRGLALELAVVPEQLPPTSFQYTGFTGGVTPRPRGFGVSAGLALVYEHRFRTR